MSNTAIQLRKSGVTGNVPPSLEYGELALNYADGKLYYKNSGNVITYISSGPATNSFATINANSSLILATSNTDILSIGGANNITVTSDGFNKSITIGAQLSDSVTLTNSQIGASANAVANLYSNILNVRDIAGVAGIQSSNALALAQIAYNQANTGTDLAQAAFDYANTLTGGGGSGSTVFFNYLTVEKQLYTANASQTDFFAHYTAPFVTVVVNGVTIDASEYSTGTANTIILNTPANAGDVVDITGFSQANSATISSGGGAGTDQWVRDTANNAVANTIVTQGVDAWQNTEIIAVNNYATGAYNAANGATSLAQGAYNQANTNASFITFVNNKVEAAYAQANVTIGVDATQNTRLDGIEGVNLTQNTNITAVNNFAQSAYNTANGKFNSTGGTIAGDTVITGNLSVTGTTFYANTVNLTVEDNIITLNSNVTGTPTLDSGIEVNRGNQANTSLVWNESDKAWELTNNGTTFNRITTNDVLSSNISLLQSYITSANANISVLFGIEDTQNTNITAVNQFAQSAYNQANVTLGIDVTQNTRIQSLETVNNNQNTSISIIQGVDDWQNTEITSVNQYAQGAFDKANTVTGNYTFSGNNIALISNASGNLSVSEGSSSTTTTTYTRNPDANSDIGHFDYANIDTSAKTITFRTYGGASLITVIQGLYANGTTINVAYDGTDTYNITPGITKYGDIVLTSFTQVSGTDWVGTYNETLTPLTNSTRVFILSWTTTSGSVTNSYYEFGKDSTLSIKRNANTSSISATTLVIDGVNIPEKIESAYAKANASFANTTGTFDGSLTTTGNVIINSGISSTSNTTGSLIINGGVGVTGNVYADKIYVNGLYWAANGNVISTGGSTSVNQFNIYKYIATAGQTTFSGPDSASVSLNYTVGAIIVTLNGLTLKPGTDYTATDGSSITLTVAADLSDELNIYGFTSTTVNTANTLSVFSYSASAGQTSFGGVDQNGNSLGYVPGNLFTTYNGITLRNGVDYTAANGSYINLTFSATANDEVVVYTFGAFNVANTYTTSQADAKFTTAGKALAMNFFRS